MTQIDLDDLPPTIARQLVALEAGEALVVVRGGVVVARLTADSPPAPAAVENPPPEEAMAEVMEQFKAMIEDEF